MSASIVNDRLVGPYVLPNRLNSAQYLEFLNNVSKEQLDVEVPLGEPVYMWSLDDGAPLYFARPVTEWLNNHFITQWIDRNDPVAWLPRSPDLNPCDFCLWSWMKQLVYGNHQCPETKEKFQQRVEVAATTVRGTAVLFYVSVQTCCDVLKSVLLVKVKVFDIYRKKVVAF